MDTTPRGDQSTADLIDDEGPFQEPQDSGPIEVVLVSTVIIDYLRRFSDVLASITPGIGSELDYIKMGKTVTAREISESLFETRKEPSTMDILLEYSYLYPYLLALVPLFVFPQYALGIGIVELGLIVLYNYFKPQAPRDMETYNSYIRIRDPSPLIEILGDMMGFVSVFISEPDGNKSFIEKHIDGIVLELTSPGGFLSIDKIQRITYEIKKIEGIALLFGHIQITIDDFKSYIEQQGGGSSNQYPPVGGSVYGPEY